MSFKTVENVFLSIIGVIGYNKTTDVQMKVYVYRTLTQRIIMIQFKGGQ